MIVKLLPLCTPLTYEQIPVHKYFIVDGDPQRKVFLKTQAPGAFLLQEGGCDWIQAIFFQGKGLWRVVVRSASIEVKQGPGTTW